MRLCRKLTGLVAVCLMTASCLAPSRTDKKTQALLSELDGYLALREAYAAKKQNQLDVYRNLALATTDPVRRYEVLSTETRICPLTRPSSA